LAAGLRFCGHCGALLAVADANEVEAAADPWMGRVVDGRYRVVGRIGAGGMGVVYRVEHLALGKTAAMKVLSPETAQKPEMLRRFRLEAQAVSRLNHPNIVQTFDFGQFEDALYLVMEFIKGDDLAALLKRDGSWEFPRAGRFFAQVCSGLAEAHDAGIVHRDLKPENLMLVRRKDGTEHAKVLDFGLAKLRERSTDQHLAISTGGQVMGTPYYMSPEQVRGEPLDARADIYSLGATLYRVLTGEPPFDAPSPMSVLSKHLTDEVVPPRNRPGGASLPSEADRIVLRAMAKRPEDRYASAIEIAKDLERALAAPSRDSSFSGATASFSPSPAATVSNVGEASTIAAENVRLDRSDSGEELDRLRRSDVDDYEVALRRRRILTRVGYPLGLLGVAAAVVFILRRGSAERADGQEHEPNNTPGYANLLAQGPVRGAIGKPINEREGDVDFFRVPSGVGARALHARLQRIPGVDVVLELFDGRGERLAKSDANGRGQGEWMQPTSIGPGEVYLAVREVWIEGTKPTANALDPYTLTARWGPPQPGWEVEPNDGAAMATSLPADGKVRGYLGRADDRDWFTVKLAKKASVAVKVNAPAGVDIVALRDEEGKRSVNKAGPGDDEAFSIDVEPNKPVVIGVARHIAPNKDPKEQDLDGLDDPYELSVALPED
jgi:eukaryotic-like serine/threonine-protein kinase